MSLAGREVSKERDLNSETLRKNAPRSFQVSVGRRSKHTPLVLFCRTQHVGVPLEPVACPSESVCKWKSLSCGRITASCKC